MQTRLNQERSIEALLRHARKYTHELAPHGVITPLLYVSRVVHARATRIYYSDNTFHFPSPEAGFMTLEASLVTIGRTNAWYLRSLRAHVPQWHAGVQSDAIEGAMQDALSPATRLAVLKPPGEDRLLSAIENCNSMLAKVGNLASLQLDLLYQQPARHFISQSLQTRLGLVHQVDAAAFVERKSLGIGLLKHASARLTTTPSSRPVVGVLSIEAVRPHVARQFKSILASILREADKHVWRVDPILGDPNLWKRD